MTSPAAPRSLGLFDCVGIGLNGIVGSGIFLLPAFLYGAAGPASIVALPLCGLLCLGVGLCFGEMAGLAGARSGGPYRFATLAFGETAGFLVGWIAVASGLLGYAAVARGLSERLAALLPSRRGVGPAAPRIAAVTLIAFLGAVNLVGVKAGARLSDLLSVTKLAPLVLLVVAGLPHVEAARVWPPLPPEGAGLSVAIWISVFACSGFEYVTVPAAEAKDPARDVPRAVIGSIAAALGLYALVQLVAVGTVAGLGETKAPLEAAARVALGEPGAALLAAGAVVSMIGFCSGSALVGPRYLSSLAADGHLPAPLAARSARFGTPYVAIVALSLGAAALAASLDFRRLVDFSNVAIVAQYLPTCAAVILLRRTRPELPRTYRVPGGALIPAACIVAIVALLALHARPPELLTGGFVLLGGLALHGLRRLRRA